MASTSVELKGLEGRGRDRLEAITARLPSIRLEALRPAAWLIAGALMGAAVAELSQWIASSRALMASLTAPGSAGLALGVASAITVGVLELRRTRALRPEALDRQIDTARSPSGPDSGGRRATGSGAERRYQLISVLGRGGFGTVYRGRLLLSGGFSKSVALKVLRGDHEQVNDLVRRLCDEARLLALVQHRAIVRVDELVELEGRKTIVMECVDGCDLNSILERGAIPTAPALQIAAEIASALHTAYSTAAPDGRPLRLVHRDIKPANICVTASGDVKLLDFGIASADLRGRQNTTMGQTFGTPEYMAPERFGFSSGPEADVYALGATLYELLTGLQFGRAKIDPAEHTAATEHRLWRLWRRLGDDEGQVIQLIGEMLAYSTTARPTARDVERRLLRLVRRYPGVTLQDWAEEHIPRIRRAEEPVDLRPAGPTACVYPEAGSPRLVASDEVSAATWPRPLDP